MSETTLLLRRQADAQTTAICHLVDLDATPFAPDGWTIKKHTKGGQFDFHPKRVELYRTPAQSRGMIFIGSRLLKELSRERVLNACLIDFYLKNPHLYPEEWEGYDVCFPGTVFLSEDGCSCIRYLRLSFGTLRAGIRWLGAPWTNSFPALVRID